MFRFGLVNSNALISINIVRRARFMPGWVTILGGVNHLGVEPDLLSLSHPSMGKRDEFFYTSQLRIKTDWAKFTSPAKEET